MIPITNCLLSWDQIRSLMVDKYTDNIKYTSVVDVCRLTEYGALADKCHDMGTLLEDIYSSLT